MQCPRCHQRNTETAKFCEECGNRLLHTCPACGHEVSPTAKFCSDCGEPLIRQSQVQSLKSKVEDILDTRRQTPDPRPVSYTPRHLAERIRAEQAARATRGAPDGERSRREKITGRVLTLDRSLKDTLPYLFALLGIV